MKTESLIVMSYHSPVGWLRLEVSHEAVVGVYFEDQPTQRTSKQSSALLERLIQQLDEYFAGTRREFDLPLAHSGTDFQESAWQALQGIPYAETRTYGQQARQAGSPRAARAIGQANNRNPLSILIPCHRVIGAQGKLTGYGGGLNKKQWLLDHEQEVVQA